MGGVKKESLILGKKDFVGGNMNESESEIDSGSESDMEEIPTSEPSKKAIYNREGILDKLEDIKWPENINWLHKLTIDHDPETEIDVNDDIVRELAFYTQALEGTREAYAKIQSLGIPFFRPPDYYAEMVKTDIHMLKVKGKLLDQKKKIEEAEERKKARESKKMAKEVQALKLKERAKQKKEDIESVKKWRKQRQQSGFPASGGGGGDLGLDLDGGGGFEGSKKRRPAVAPGDRSGGSKRGGLSKQREKRNSKFGYGGRKGMKKQNTAETTDDLRSFNKGGDSSSRKRKSR
ncbi:rRNA processing protein-like protein [Wolffia australiana]